MDRFFSLILIGVMLWFAQASCPQPRDEAAQPVFFSLLFPQLSPFSWLTEDAPQDIGIIDAEGTVFL